MKTILSALKYNLKNYFIAWLLFSVVWLIFSTILMYFSSIDTFLENSASVNAQLEKSLTSKDVVELKETMWRLKTDSIHRIDFIPNADFSIISRNLTIGQQSTMPWQELRRAYTLTLNGLTLGNVNVYINTFGLLKSSLWDNVGLFFFVAIFFILLTIYANVKTTKALYNIESKIELVNEGDFNNLESVLSDIPEKSWSAISGFKGFIYNYLKLSEEKSALDIELHDFEYRYKLAREVAHGIKSPVHTLNVLNKKISQKMTESERKLFNMACERINYHANEILSQSDNNRTSKVNVRNAIKKLINMKRNEFKKYKDIEIIYEDDTNEILDLPVQSIYEILSNLINNAFDAIENNVGSIKVKTYLDKNMLTIKCEDSGKGIPNSVITKIWDTDFSYQKKHGSGIGLSMIKDLVESKWKGKCFVQSHLGVGTTFELQIPVS